MTKFVLFLFTKLSLRVPSKSRGLGWKRAHSHFKSKQNILSFKTNNLCYHCYQQFGIQKKNSMKLKWFLSKHRNVRSYLCKRKLKTNPQSRHFTKITRLPSFSRNFPNTKMATTIKALLPTLGEYHQQTSAHGTLDNSPQEQEECYF